MGDQPERLGSEGVSTGLELTIESELCMEIDPLINENIATAEDWRKVLNNVPAVAVLCTTACHAFDTESASAGYATGFVTDKRRGIVVTNCHVKPEPAVVEATFLNREEIPVFPLYRDPVHDFGNFRYDPKQIRILSYEEIPLATEAASVGLEIRVVGNDIGEKVGHVDDGELSNMEEGSVRGTSNDNQSSTGVPTNSNLPPNSSFSVVLATTLQKLIAEFIGTYLIVFTGCAALIVEKTEGKVTYPGICVTWGLIVMIVVYTFQHISCHFNPAATITYALLRGFPWKQVPFYICAQILGSFLASVTLYFLLDVPPKVYFGNLPSGSDAQSFVMEIIVSFILMFVIFGTAFDKRAHSLFAGVAIGMTVIVNGLIAGTISGGSMNPARSIGPAVLMHVYKGLWIYIVGPTIGCILGGVAYSLMQYMDRFPAKVAGWSTASDKKLINWFGILKGKFFDAFHKVH